MLMASIRIIAAISAGVSLIGVAALSAQGQHAVHQDKVFSGGTTRDGDPGTIHSIDLINGNEREVFRPNRGVVFDFKVAPSSELIAIRTQILKYDVPPEDATTIVAGGRRVFEETTLTMLTVDGLAIDSIPNVRSYAWSPDSLRLVYVIGDYRGKETDYDNTSVWIWDSAGKGRVRISDRGHVVIWPSFDDNIYIWPRTRGIAGEAMKYNVASGSLEPTSHVSIYFSPSGSYYYHPGGGVGLQENVYITAGDVALKATSLVLSQLSGWRALGWAPDADLLLMEASRQSRGIGPAEFVLMVFDPKLDSATELQASGVLGWGNTRHQLLVRTGDRVQRKAVVEFAVAKP